MYHDLGMDATERDRRRGGSASTHAKGSLDVADRVIERREPRGRRRAGGGSDIGAPIGVGPLGGVYALSIPSGGGALAIEDEIGREPCSRKLARGEAGA